MALCRTCSSFDIQTFKEAPYQTRGYRLEDVKISVRETACVFCSFLLETALSIETETPKKSIRWIHLRMSKDKTPWRTNMVFSRPSGPPSFNRLDIMPSNRNALFLRRKTGEKSWEEKGFQCRLLADPTSMAFSSGDVGGVYLGDDRSSEYHFSSVASWLVDCLAHERCNTTVSGCKIDSTSVDLPTRCLAVGEQHLRLENTSGERGAYVALSHRWSHATGRMSTNAANIEERHCSLAIEDLTQTFQDAITVTRRLGIPYLWIDSLCIIQSGDEGRDWRTEALQMSQYYQSAILTIAAANASESGFLNPGIARPKNQIIRLPYFGATKTQNGFLYIQKQDVMGGVNGQYALQVANGELLNRGWVLQEWLLSRRIVHYTEDQIFFECQSLPPRNDANETARPEHLAELRLVNRTGVTGAETQQVFSLHQTIPAEQLTPRSMWHRIVEAYSGTRLTRPNQDRILALAGVAKEIRHLIRADGHAPEGECQQEPYAAGWWLTYIHMGLTWEQRNEGPRKPSLCGAPTWSWAAWLNPVHWRNPDNNMQASCEIKGLLDADQYEQRGIVLPRYRSERLYDVDNEFAWLLVRGKVRLVLVGDRLVEKQREDLAELTGVPSELTSRWTSLSTPEAPEDLIGWADIEYDRANCPVDGRRSGQIVLALHVSTQPDVHGGLEHGYMSFTHEVSIVLFLTPLHRSSRQPTNRYGRLGVGRIFQKDFFKHADEMDIELS